MVNGDLHGEFLFCRVRPRFVILELEDKLKDDVVPPYYLFVYIMAAAHKCDVTKTNNVENQETAPLPLLLSQAENR